jgi:beta-lactamase class A
LTRPHVRPLRWISLLLILTAITLVSLELNQYVTNQVGFPAGSMIAEVSVGGLDRQQVAGLLSRVYLQPVEVHYNQAVFQIDPSDAGFYLDIEAMLDAAEAGRAPAPFWQGFLDYLWNRPEPPVSVGLAASVDKAILRNFLETQITTRYDQPPRSAAPVPGTPYIKPGVPGTVLDLDQAVSRISTALLSPTQRVVTLTGDEVDPPKPGISDLQVLMQQIIRVSDFRGIAEVYLTDLRTFQNIHFVYQSGANPQPALNIAFSGWSTIKIPIMVSAFRRMADPAPESSMNLLGQMIALSDNTAADLLAQSVIDRYLAPLLVTKDMQTLGLNNTFWGGFFYPGAPLLQLYKTPANQRKDVDTGPDLYDQTTPADLGMLLEDIYQCSQTGGGALTAAFPGEITRNECLEMIALLSEDDIQQLIQAGLPYGTRWAHKHGWANEYQDGLIHTMGDAGIAYTPGGDFVIVVFVNDPVQILWDQVNRMIAYLGKAAYNFFNVTIEK